MRRPPIRRIERERGVSFHLHVSSKLRERLRRMANEQGISDGQLVRVALVKYIEETMAARGAAFIYDPPSVRR